MPITRSPKVRRAPADEIRDLYYNATPKSVARDLDRAIDLLKAMDSEDERERVAVYMDGLSQMRSEWASARPPGPSAPAAGTRRRTPR